MTTRTPAIETHGLRKCFDDKVAVQDLTLTVERGEVFGFLGPNGAGKTTSIKMLLSLISPSAGHGQVLGARLNDPAVRKRVGFLPEQFRFHDWMKGRDFLQLHADLYHMPREKSRTRIDELLDLVGLTLHANKKIREYSKGMLQRIGLAQAMVNKPDLIFLDEPTSGLDPVGRRLVRDIIHELRNTGTTIFLNSHLLSEVEVTCDRVAFIKYGEVIRVNPLQSLIDGELSVEIHARNLHPKIIAGLERWSRNVRVDGEHLSLTIDSEVDLPLINRYLVEEGVDVYSLRPNQLSLEDLFIQIVGTDGGL